MRCGAASGTSGWTYDANEKLIRVDLGQSDQQDRPEYSTFVQDNEGHIIYKLHDDGKSSYIERYDLKRDGTKFPVLRNSSRLSGDSPLRSSHPARRRACTRSTRTWRT